MGYGRDGGQELSFILCKSSAVLFFKTDFFFATLR